KISAAVAKFDQHIVVTGFELAARGRKCDSEIVYGLCSKEFAGRVSVGEFVPGEIPPVNKGRGNENRCDNSGQAATNSLGRNQGRWHKHGFFFMSILQVAPSPDDVDHRVNEQLQ